MDLVHERASIVREEEDRISKLPDDIIRRILSFLDMKCAVQTSAVSSKWKCIWTSMPYLNLDSRLPHYHNLRHFARFVKEALSHRNKKTNLSAVDLKFEGSAKQYVIESIVNYANSHHIRQMTIEWFTPKFSNKVPEFFFKSDTLKHLSLVVKHSNYSHLNGDFGTCYLLESTWDFPALETLYLSGMELVNYDRDEKNIKLFSKCVNLQDLTLHVCSMHRMKIVNVCCPQLSNLTMKDVVFPEVLEVVSPKLKNLTASVMSTVGRSSVNFLQLSVEGSISLEKVNLSKSNENDLKTRNFSQLLDLLQKLSSAKFLILDMEIIQTLASDLVQLSCESCPFHNLKSLKINTSRLQHTDPMPKIPTQIQDYLLDNSRNATFFIDSTQVPRKRARQEVHEDTLANKVAKLEEKLQNQDAVIVEQKEKIQMLEAAKLQHENFMSRVFKSKIEGLQVQIESGNPDYEVIRSVGRNIKSVMDLIPKSLRVDIEAQLSTQYEELKSLLLTCIDPSEWAKIEKELGIKRNSERICCDNIGVQSDVSVAELLKAQSPSSTNRATSSRATL